jgi:hypothetical protein
MREQRHQQQQARRRGGVVAVAALVTLAALVVAGWYGLRGPDETGLRVGGNTSPPTTSPSVPAACVDALGLADLLASHVGPLADAANAHVEVMEKLDLYLEGKPGGITGKQAYDQGATQMAVMEDHGPDAEVQTRRYQEVRKRCPIS